MCSSDLYVTITSSNIAKALVKGLDEPCRQQLQSGRVRIVSISSVTSEALRQLGLPVAAEAHEATMAGVVEALIALEK